MQRGGGTPIPASIIFDSYDMTPLWTCEDDLIPGAARGGAFKAVFNLRGDDGAPTGNLAVDSNLGWKGPGKYVATLPQIFNLLDDPKERYDIFMNNFTEHTWYLPVINDAVKERMKTYIEHPPARCRARATRVRSH